MKIDELFSFEYERLCVGCFITVDYLNNKFTGKLPQIGALVEYNTIATGAFELTTKTIYTISGTKWVNVSVDINGNNDSKCYLKINGNVVAYYARVHDGYSPLSWSGIATGKIEFQASSAKIQDVRGSYCINEIVYS